MLLWSCRTVWLIWFRIITFELRRIARIARRADRGRDHRGCVDKYCFSTFGFSATLNPSKLQVVKVIVVVVIVVVAAVVVVFRINSHNQVRGHRTSPSHTVAEEYPRRKTQTNQW